MDFTDILFEIEGKIKFYNISYRNYHGIWSRYIFNVTPFTLNVYDLLGTHNGNLNFKGVENLIYYKHHTDYMNQSCKKDPCDIYEIVSGDRIHNGGSDKHKRNLGHKYYQPIKDEFEVELKSMRRIKKIDSAIS